MFGTFEACCTSCARKEKFWDPLVMYMRWTFPLRWEGRVLVQNTRSSAYPKHTAFITFHQPMVRQCCLATSNQMRWPRKLTSDTNMSYIRQQALTPNTPPFYDNPPSHWPNENQSWARKQYGKEICKHTKWISTSPFKRCWPSTFISLITFSLCELLFAVASLYMWWMEAIDPIQWEWHCEGVFFPPHFSKKAAQFPSHLPKAAQLPSFLSKVSQLPFLPPK